MRCHQLKTVMRTVLFFAFMLSFGTIAIAQDKIVKKDGAEIECKVIEITDELIKYRKLDNLEGPLYSLKKSDITVIQYENGTLDVFNEQERIPETWDESDTIPIVEPVQLQGPRLGVIFVEDEIFTNVGWQEEYIFFSSKNGFATVGEMIFMVAGIEQNKFYPSLTTMLGFRDKSGFEIGFGPNVSLSGAAFAIAIGVTARTEKVNIPFNLAFVPSKDGLRVSLLTGFNFRKRRPD